MEENKRMDFEISIIAVEMDATNKRIFSRMNATASCDNIFGMAIVCSFFKRYPEMLPIFKQSIDIIENQPQVADLLKEVKS